MKRMKKYITRLLTMICLSAGFLLVQKTDAAAAADEFSMSISVTEYYDRGLEIVRYINEERERLGVAPLTIDADLQDIAMQRATEQLLVGGHTRPNGTSGITADWTGTGKFAAENAAHGGFAEDYSAANLYNTWKNSKGHYAAMVNAGFKTIGVGVITGNNNRSGGAIIAFGYNLQNNVNPNIKSGTQVTLRTVEGLKMQQCIFAPKSASSTCVYMDDKYYFSRSIEPLNLRSAGEWTAIYGKDLECFRFESLTPDIATVSSDGYITAYKSGTVALRATLKSNPALTTTSTFTIELPQKEPEKPSKVRNFLVKVKKGSYTYTGKAIKPKVKVYWWDENDDPVPWIYGYKVSYSHNKAVGTAKIRVQGTGIYKDLKGTATFTIKPRKVQGVSLKSSKKKQLTVKWKKDASVQGYEVQYSTSKKFKNDKIKKIAGKSKTGVTLKKLKSGKTYYVRMRSYKVSDGRKLYSAWSSKKKVRIR